MNTLHVSITVFDTSDLRKSSTTNDIRMYIKRLVRKNSAYCGIQLLFIITILLLSCKFRMYHTHKIPKTYKLLR